IAMLIVVASFIGRNRAQESQKQLIEKHFPDTLYHLKSINANKWILHNKTTKKENFLYMGEGLGYNGKLYVLVQTDLDKLIDQVIPLAHHETPSFFKKLNKNHFYRQISGKEIKTFLENEPIDVISGATISSKAVMQAIQNAYSKAEDISISQTNYPVFGFLEFFVLFLLIIGFLIVKIKNVKLKKNLLWISMLLSVIVLGFVYNQHITLSRISAILNGYFPSLSNELYYYILLFGSILIILLTKKNTYCHSVCPFGVAQELLAKIGNAKPFRPKYYQQLKFMQGLITLLALLVSLALDNPTLAQYEVFGAFFQLTANSIIFAVLFINIVLSLFVHKPWCNFMCPIDRFFAYIKLTRKSITDIWKS
ncbi:MAG: hypothetical protein DRJ10_08570, partial [Bacteroidetes bacterium]